MYRIWNDKGYIENWVPILNIIFRFGAYMKNSKF